jgi:hypothetical protein
VSPLASGALYELSFGNIESSDGEPLTPFSRAFTTEGTFAPSGVVAHWNFESNANDVVGTWNPSEVIAITYEAGRNAAAGQAAVFDGDASIIEIPNGDQLMDTDDFTLSFWVKTNSSGHVNDAGDPAGYFVIGLGAFYGFQFEIAGNFSNVKLAARYELADGTTEGEDLWFPGDGVDNTNGGWQGWVFTRDLTGSGGVAGLIQDKWTHIVCTYDAESKVGSMYINGDLMKQQDFDLWPDDAPKRTVVGIDYAGAEPEVYPELAFGFIQSRAGTLWDSEPWGGYDFPTANHFKGSLDDISIFHTALTETEVELMYNSEMP